MYTDTQLIRKFEERKWKKQAVKIQRRRLVFFLSVVSPRRYFRLTHEGLYVIDSGSTWRLGGFTPWATEFYQRLMEILALRALDKGEPQ